MTPGMIFSYLVSVGSGIRLKIAFPSGIILWETMVTLTIDHWIAADRRVFNTKKKYIHGALKGETGIIDGVTEQNKEDIFYMLMFCLCVPQSRAIKAEEAIEVLREQDFYTKSLSLDQVVKILTGRVRFQSTKAQRLMDAKELFLEVSQSTGTIFWEELCSRFRAYSNISDETRDVTLQSIRNFLINRVNGVGMKLSSHFMRNIGMAGLAILDVHVIDGLKKRGVVDIEKLGPSQAEYLQVEDKMKEYAKEVGIELDELDLLLWSQKTGYVFK